MNILKFRKIIYTLLFNSALLSILMIGIQNSSNKAKVNFLIRETIYLPVSFIIGISFISGSVTSVFFTLNSEKEKE